MAFLVGTSKSHYCKKTKVTRMAGRCNFRSCTEKHKRLFRTFLHHRKESTQVGKNFSGTRANVEQLMKESTTNKRVILKQLRSPTLSKTLVICPFLSIPLSSTLLLIARVRIGKEKMWLLLIARILVDAECVCFSLTVVVAWMLVEAVAGLGH